MCVCEKAGAEVQRCRNEIEKGSWEKALWEPALRLKFGSIHVGGGERISVLTKKETKEQKGPSGKDRCN